jgi:hypothetical protein
MQVYCGSGRPGRVDAASYADYRRAAHDPLSGRRPRSQRTCQHLRCVSIRPSACQPEQNASGGRQNIDATQEVAHRGAKRGLVLLIQGVQEPVAQDGGTSFGSTRAPAQSSYRRFTGVLHQNRTRADCPGRAVRGDSASGRADPWCDSACRPQSRSSIGSDPCPDSKDASPTRGVFHCGACSDVRQLSSVKPTFNVTCQCATFPSIIWPRVSTT